MTSLAHIALAPYAVTAATGNSRGSARVAAAGAPRTHRCAPRLRGVCAPGQYPKGLFQCPIRRRRPARARICTACRSARRTARTCTARRATRQRSDARRGAPGGVSVSAFPERRLRRAAHPRDARGRAPPRCRLCTHAASVARRLACARARRGTARGGWKHSGRPSDAAPPRVSATRPRAAANNEPPVGSLCPVLVEVRTRARGGRCLETLSFCDRSPRRRGRPGARREHP